MTKLEMSYVQSLEQKAHELELLKHKMSEMDKELKFNKNTVLVDDIALKKQSDEIAELKKELKELKDNNRRLHNTVSYLAKTGVAIREENKQLKEKLDKVL